MCGHRILNVCSSCCTDDMKVRTHTYYIYYMCIDVCEYHHTRVEVKDRLRESVLSFYSGASGVELKCLLSGEDLYPLNRLAGPEGLFLNVLHNSFFFLFVLKPLILCFPTQGYSMY